MEHNREHDLGMHDVTEERRASGIDMERFRDYRARQDYDKAAGRACRAAGLSRETLGGERVVKAMVEVLLEISHFPADTWIWWKASTVLDV